MHYININKIIYAEYIDRKHTSCDFIGSASPYVISQQWEFNNFDSGGEYLSSLLSAKKSVKVITSNGNWLRHFYLPNIEQSEQNDIRISFVANAELHSIVHYNNTTLHLDKGDTAGFTHGNGTWHIYTGKYIKLKRSKTA